MPETAWFNLLRPVIGRDLVLRLTYPASLARRNYIHLYCFEGSKKWQVRLPPHRPGLVRPGTGRKDGVISFFSCNYARAGVETSFVVQAPSINGHQRGIFMKTRLQTLHADCVCADRCGWQCRRHCRSPVLSNFSGGIEKQDGIMLLQLLAPRHSEPSPALQCWVSSPPRRKPRRDGHEGRRGEMSDELPQGWRSFQPVRAKDNSPPIYRWDSGRSKMSSPGRDERNRRRHSGYSFAPGGACGNSGRDYPAMNRRAIFGRPNGTTESSFRPGGTGFVAGPGSQRSSAGLLPKPQVAPRLATNRIGIKGTKLNNSFTL